MGTLVTVIVKHPVVLSPVKIVYNFRHHLKLFAIERKEAQKHFEKKNRISFEKMHTNHIIITENLTPYFLPDNLKQNVPISSQSSMYYRKERA